jgi:hypothetical protein
MTTRREVFYGALAAASFAATGISAAAPAAAPQTSIDPMNLVNPQFRARLQDLLKQPGGFNVTPDKLAQVRAAARARAMPALAAPEAVERSIPGLRAHQMSASL